MNSILSLSHLQAKDDNVEVWVKRDVPSANELKKMSDLTGVRVRFMCPSHACTCAWCNKLKMTLGLAGVLMCIYAPFAYVHLCLLLFVPKRAFLLCTAYT